MTDSYYDGSPSIINLSKEIGVLLGIVDANLLQKPKMKLRRRNKISSIRASLAIEGNSLTEEQVTALIDQKRVIGPAKEIQEVKNAIQVYDQLHRFDPLSGDSLLDAHHILMNGLIDATGTYRTGNVGILQGGKVAHLAPPAWNVHHLMNELIDYLKNGMDNWIIKSCVFHYELEFIHPFLDGNGRMGRLWQTLILMKENPVFEFLPVEKEIKAGQEKYHEVLARSDKEGKATRFVEYMLGKIRYSLQDLLKNQRPGFSDLQRLEHFLAKVGDQSFSRKDYMRAFPGISSATATRDLRKGVENGWLKRSGANRLTTYRKAGQ